MKVLTYTSYKEYFELCTKMYRPTAPNSCHIKLVKKYLTLLLDAALKLYKAGLQNECCR